MNLYAINEELKAAIELADQDEELSREDGQYLFDIIKGLNIDRDQKLENIGKLFKNESALADMIDSEIKALQARKAAHSAKAKALKEWAKINMQAGEKREFGAVSYSWHNSESLEILCPEKIPDCWCKIERTPMKTEIKAAIKSGIIAIDESICKLVKNSNLQIK